MGTQILVALLLSLLFLYGEFSRVQTASVYSSRLIHRFSDEAASYWASKGKNVSLLDRGTAEHMKVLLSSDLKRQRLKLGSHNQLLIPSHGSKTFFYGNDMGW